MSKSRTVAEFMLGKGFLNSGEVGKALNIPTFTASQAMQAIRRAGCYQTQEEKRGQIMYVKLISIDGFSITCDKSARLEKLWRLAIFGEQLQ